MKKLLLLFALVAGTLALTGGSTALADGPGPFVVSGSDSGRQQTGTTDVGVAGGSTGQFAGQTCTITGRADNQASVHLDNNLIIRSGSSSVTLYNVERESGAVTLGGGSLVLGDSISIDRYVGNDDWSNPVPKQFESPYGSPPIGLFSARVTIAVDCEPEDEPDEPAFTATGECVDDGFGVTVTNTGNVRLDDVAVEGGNTLSLDPGESKSTPADDTTGDGNVTVSAEGGQLTQNVPFLDCEPEEESDEPAFTAFGQCIEDGVFEDGFVVTVTNTGDVPLTIDVEGGSSVTLNPGSSESTPADDTNGDGNVTLSADGGQLTQTVPFQDCTEPFLELTAIRPVCRQDIPYIEYAIAVAGLDPAPTTADITLLDVNRNPIPGGKYLDQPLSGQLIWPGATEDPDDWPGWALNSEGLWVIDASDALYREGIILQAEVNPTGEALVEYPPETSACNGPQVVPPPTTPPSAATPPSLPTTGGETTLFALFGVLFASAGGLLLLFPGVVPSERQNTFIRPEGVPALRSDGVVGRAQPAGAERVASAG